MFNPAVNADQEHITYKYWIKNASLQDYNEVNKKKTENIESDYLYKSFKKKKKKHTMETNFRIYVTIIWIQ